MAERVIADHKVTCSNQVTSFDGVNYLFGFFWVVNPLPYKNLYPTTYIIFMALKNIIISISISFCS